VEYHWLDNQFDRLPALMDQLELGRLLDWQVAGFLTVQLATVIASRRAAAWPYQINQRRPSALNDQKTEREAAMRQFMTTVTALVLMRKPGAMR
jgi:hypothetical protein